MRDLLRRLVSDFQSRKNIDAYVITFLSLIFAVATVIGDVIPVNLRWAAILSGVGLLVYRLTMPTMTPSVDQVFVDRSSFDDIPFYRKVADAREVWIAAPSAVNLLSPQNCEALRSSVLSRGDGSLRIVVLDPTEVSAVKIASRQLDGDVDYPVQELSSSLENVVRLLGNVALWEVAGVFEYRLAKFNPGFSLVAIDPLAHKGRILVEIHGYHNQSTSTRMHFELTRQLSDRWYAYWLDQFECIWRDAVSVESGKTQLHG
ncbi:hypothetical protein ACGFJC_39810 [Nonomuraea fuscirosea]|uniref:hypothetical protein n=1 Tax=Nonomuraea fuscirosea TaxID=1291556 RepID=UPI00370FC924